MSFLAQQLFEDHEKLALEYRKAHGLVAEDVMTEPVVTILPGTPVEEIAHLMAERHIKRVPVVDHGKLVGIVSRGDILRAAYDRIVALHDGEDGRPHSDQEIVTELLAELRDEPWAEVNHIRPTCHDGVVRLAGRGRERGRARGGRDRRPGRGGRARRRQRAGDPAWPRRRGLRAAPRADTPARKGPTR